MDEREDISSLVHHAIVRRLIGSGECPSIGELARSLGIDQAEVRDALRALEDAHGIVLDPADGTPWVVHPFSCTPTGTYVDGGTRGWWAPCLWCGLGVAALVGGDVRIHARLGGEAESLVIDVRDGHPTDTDVCCVHFAVPPRDAWRNVHAHCAMLLPFRARADVREWAGRHALPFGEVITLDQTAALARAWYGHHADRGWHKWTVAEAQSIFDAVGLRSAFWNLQTRTGSF